MCIHLQRFFDFIPPLSPRSAYFWQEVALWENFMVSERIKKRAYSGMSGSYHFWRTYAGQEIDYLAERDGSLFGFEFNWSENRRVRPPKNWREAYPEATWQKVTQEDYLDFAG
jgi:predicted AAA+ superfamily ATPase